MATEREPHRQHRPEHGQRQERDTESFPTVFGSQLYHPRQQARPRHQLTLACHVTSDPRFCDSRITLVFSADASFRLIYIRQNTAMEGGAKAVIDEDRGVDLISSGRFCQDGISSMTSSVIRLIVSLLTEAP